MTEEANGGVPGSGNVNVVWQALMEISSYDGNARYTFDQVPQKMSTDGYVRVIDGLTRGSFYGAPPAAKSGKTPADDRH